MPCTLDLPVWVACADTASVAPEGGGKPVGPELSRLLNVEVEGSAIEGVECGSELTSLAFCAASEPT